MGHTPSDVPGISKVPVTREEALRILSWRSTLSELLNSFTGKDLMLLSAEELVNTLQEVLIFSISFFKQEHFQFSRRNPLVIPGDTNVSKDPTKVGTVDSRIIYSKRGWIDAQKDIVNFLEKIYEAIGAFHDENYRYNRQILINFGRQLLVQYGEKLHDGPPADRPKAYTRLIRERNRSGAFARTFSSKAGSRKRK